MKLVSGFLPISLAVPSKEWVWGLSLAGTASSNTAGAIDVCLSVLSVVCCQLEVAATAL